MARRLTALCFLIVLACAAATGWALMETMQDLSSTVPPASQEFADIGR